MKSIKNMIRIPFYIIISLLLITFVNADFTVDSQANLGSTTQERGSATSTTITVTNTDAANALTAVNGVFTTTLSGYSNSDFNVTLSGSTTPISVLASGSATLTVQGKVPLKFDSKNQQIGNLVISGVSSGTTYQKTVPVYMNAISKLKITKVELDINGDSNSVSDGKTIKVKRGDKLEVSVKVESLFPSSGNIDISDITVTADNNDLDVNEEDTIGTLSPRDDDTALISFDVPEDADDSKDTLAITVEGTDDNNAVHTVDYEFYLDVQVDRYDLKVNKISPPISGICPGQTANINVEIENSGVRDLDYAQLYITVDDLSFTKKISDIVIDNGDTKTVSASVLVPSDAKPGNYIVSVKPYYDRSSDSLKNEESENFVVKDCSKTSTPTATIGANPSASGFQITSTPDVPSNAVFATPVTKKATTTGLFGNTDNVVLILIFTNVLILIILVTVLFVGKRFY